MKYVDKILIYVEKFRYVCFKKACQKLARHTYEYTLTVLKGCSKEQFFRHRILRKFVSTLQVMCFLAFIQFSKTHTEQKPEPEEPNLYTMHSV